MDDKLEALNQEIQAIVRALAQEDQMARQMADLEQQRDERRLRVRQTALLAEKEQGDLDALERGGLRALFLRLTGDREERLSKERREAMAAKLQHEQAQQDLEDIRRRIHALRERQNQLQADRRRLDVLRDEKARHLKELGGQAGEALSQLDGELDPLEQQREELSQALYAGRKAHSSLESVDRTLASAANWGTFDMMGGGVLVTMEKYNRLSDARAGIHAAQQALSEFRTELADVNTADFKLPQMESSQFLTFADYFWDNILIDWSVQQDIYDTQHQVNRLARRVQSILDQLEQQDRSLAARQAELEQRRAELLAQF